MLGLKPAASYNKKIQKVKNGIFRIGIHHFWVSVSVHHPRYRALQVAMAEWRRQAGLSQVQLAQRLDVGQSYVSKIERGEAYVDVVLFVDWCVACGVQAGVALDGVLMQQSGFAETGNL